MAKSFNRRLQQASSISAGALSAFERAATELELASRLYRETYDDIQGQIEALQEQATSAERYGREATSKARKLREFLS